MYSEHILSQCEKPPRYCISYYISVLHFLLSSPVQTDRTFYALYTHTNMNMDSFEEKAIKPTQKSLCFPNLLGQKEILSAFQGCVLIAIKALLTQWQKILPLSGHFSEI